MLVLLIVIAVLVIWGVSTYNSLITMRNRCDESLSTLDVYLKKRFDLIPNLIATVKGYAKHEADTLQQVIEMRNSAAGAQERMDAENRISGALRSIFALSESYPELKASESFINLQDQLKAVEEDIANARKYFNGCVREYNTRCMTVPSNIIANLFHFEKKEMYSVDNAAERENVKVEF